jgi:hypothetical protein
MKLKNKSLQDMDQIKIPGQIILKLKNAAPSYEVSENYGRRMGFYGDADETASGYKSICIYVQNGLSEYNDLFKEVARGIFRIQSNNQRKYPLLVFGFGKSSHLQHIGKYFDLGFLNDTMNVSKIAEETSKISGSVSCKPAIIPELFPKTGLLSLYSGKTRIEGDDLLIIIGRENEVFFNDTLQDKLTYSLKKRILLVVITNEGVSYNPKDFNFEFKPIINSKIPTTMSTSSTSFKRNLSSTLITKLQAEPLYQILKPEIYDQIIFPGIRNNLIDFYYKGGRLFKFDDRGFQTHIKYAAVIEKDTKDYLTEKELVNYKLATDFIKNYQRIKENCSKYAGIEANGVSEIYHRHSYVGREKGIVVLDIEVSLKSIDPDSNQDRIDILLYNVDERKLKFVEAKHYSNTEIWSTSQAKVIKQIKRYEAQIHSKKKDIIDEYNKYIDIANTMFSGSLPYVDDIEDKVTLMIFGFDNDQKGKRLKNLIIKNPVFEDLIVYPIGNVNKIKLDNLWKAK